MCFRKFLVAKKFMDKKGGGRSRFSVENFLSHSVEISVGGESFGVSLTSVIEKKVDERGGGVSRFSVEKFLSHTAKNIGIGILLCCVSEIFW